MQQFFGVSGGGGGTNSFLRYWFSDPLFTYCNNLFFLFLRTGLPDLANQHTFICGFKEGNVEKLLLVGRGWLFFAGPCRVKAAVFWFVHVSERVLRGSCFTRGSQPGGTPPAHEPCLTATCLTCSGFPETCQRRNTNSFCAIRPTWCLVLCSLQ